MLVVEPHVPAVEPARRRAVASIAMSTKRDPGSATVWVLGCCLLLAVTGGAFLTLGTALVARHRAESAADLAALAAAAHLLDGDAEPCSAADRVARAHRSRLSSCVVVDGSVLVVTEVGVRSPLVRLPPARARARAGGRENGDDP